MYSIPLEQYQWLIHNDHADYSASSLEEPQFQCFTHLVFLNTGAEHRYIMHFKIDIHVLWSS